MAQSPDNRSPQSRSPQNRSPQRRVERPAHPGAFTLAELLVVVGIIALLAGVALPVLLRAQKQARATQAAADLQAIATALEAYRADFYDYPRLPPTASRTTPDTGSIILAWALNGPYPKAAPSTSPPTPGDGADGAGFRVRPGGQSRVYGPYLAGDRIKLKANAAGYYTFLDAYGQPIQYLVAKAGTKPNYSDESPAGSGEFRNWIYNTDSALYNSADAGPEVLASFKPPLPTSASDAAIQTLFPLLKKSNFTGPFILWTAGVDTVFGSKDDITNIP